MPLSYSLPPLLAQATTSASTSSLEFDWPYFWWDWIPLVLLGLVLVTTLFFVRRDTKALHPGWSVALGLLRTGLIFGALVIALNPHVRSQTNAFRASRVILLVDTSTSMQQPVGDPASGGANRASRQQAVIELLKDSDLVQQLRRQHNVDVYSFQDDLSQLLVRFDAQGDAAAPENEEEQVATDPAKFDWESVLTPIGHQTRLGDSLDKLLVEEGGATLAGVVVISDGAVNAGRDISVARERAKTSQVRLVAVGVGSTEPPRNLEVARMIAPTDVQKGDSFELSAILSGQGIQGVPINVDLLQKGPNDPEPVVVLSETTSLSEDGNPTEVVFDLKPSDAGEFEYTLRARLNEVKESREEDNEMGRRVNIYDRPLRVLVIAGGPMRDYQFARNALHRHPSTAIDVWLQTGSIGISQESNRLLFRFPNDRESLFEYDVILAFDPNWTLITEEQQQLLTEWISNEGGGLFLVAGDVHTAELAASDELDPIKRLYPVLLEEVSLRLGSREQSTTAYPVGLTQEGQVAEFLKLNEEDGESAWEEFKGVYRTYPTQGVKAGTTVYAEFTDPLSRGSGGQPVLLASQRFGQGNVLYLGSPEMWRLRSLNESYFERFWIKGVRKAAEGRSKRGLQRSFFILDSREFELGQTIPLRLRALTPEFEPLVADSITLTLIGPNGSPILPGPNLERDRVRPAEYVGTYRPLLPGSYRLDFQIPDSSEVISQEIDVLFPRQEAASLVQEVGELRRMVEGTGGDYFPIESAAAEIPSRLPNRSESVTIDQKIEEVWDRQWLMCCLAGLLSVEWLTRKLLRLA